MHCLYLSPQKSFQVDNRAEETGVKGFVGRPLRSRLPTLHAARRPHGCFWGDHLEEDAGLGLADLPFERL